MDKWEKWTALAGRYGSSMHSKRCPCYPTAFASGMMRHVEKKMSFTESFCRTPPNQLISQARPMHSDVPYISCPVCKMAVAEAWRMATEMRAAAPYNK